MGPKRTTWGFTILELAISLALIAILLAVLIPALSTARIASQRSECSSNQVTIGEAWTHYLDDHGGEFPHVPIQPAWSYGGARFSSASAEPHLDADRPLNPYLPVHEIGERVCRVFRCPGDHGITDADGEVGTASRTAFRSYGTSYRANSLLLDARLAGVAQAARGIRRDEITTAASRLILMGDPVWYEQAERTNRYASWHGENGKGNILFLNLSVRFMEVTPRPQIGPAVIDPILHERKGEELKAEN